MARKLAGRKSFAERMHVDVPSGSMQGDSGLSPRSVKAFVSGGKAAGKGAKKNFLGRTAGGADADASAPAQLIEAAQRDWPGKLPVTQTCTRVLHLTGVKAMWHDLIKERTFKLDVDVADENGRTALMWAAELGHMNAVQTLLQMGADRTKKDTYNGRSALHLAARSGDVAMLRALMDRVKPGDQVAYVDDPDAHGLTPVFLAQQKGQQGLEAFAYLLQCGASFHQPWLQLDTSTRGSQRGGPQS